MTIYLAAICLVAIVCAAVAGYVVARGRGGWLR